MRLEEERRVGVASAAPPSQRDEGDDDNDELECGICCLPYDRCGRAPRRLGGARGSWKPSRCRHVICSACVCRLAREGWWEEVTCPYCRHVTSLRERANLLVAGVRWRGSGAGRRRRRLVLPPIDAELWHRVARLEEEEEEGKRGRGRRREAPELPPPLPLPPPQGPPEEEEGEEVEEGDDDAGPGRLWRALKRLLKGGGGGGGGGGRQARGGRRVRGRSRSLPPRRRPPPLINPYGSEMKDLALMTCYII